MIRVEQIPNGYMATIEFDTSTMQPGEMRTIHTLPVEQRPAQWHTFPYPSRFDRPLIAAVNVTPDGPITIYLRAPDTADRMWTQIAWKVGA